MYTKLLIIAISFGFFVAHGMEDTLLQNSLDNMPDEIFTEILGANGKTSKHDLMTYTYYKDCMLLNKTNLSETVSLFNAKNHLVPTNQTIEMCIMAATYFKTIKTLSVVNTKLHTQMLLFKPASSLADEKMLLRPDYFRKFVVFLMDIQGHFIINGLEDNGTCKLSMNAHIDTMKRWCEKTKTEYTYPAIYICGILSCPVKEHISNYTESINTPIVSAIKNLAANSSNFDNVRHLFSVISERAFSDNTCAQEKLGKCLALCTHAHNHCNDFSYTEPRKIIDFSNNWRSYMAEFHLTFDMGPMDQPSIPLAYIYKMLNI